MKANHNDASYSSTKDRIGKGKDAELPGGMTLCQRHRKSVIKTDMSFGSEWIRKSKTLLECWFNILNLCHSRRAFKELMNGCIPG
ncbi:hypothetical protein IV203_009620 [Nitzschia inconspicua]|uniref:Uncharacterized protein n=1 Tax=Nitzschia inconspicua TaxID=303405 RepID=A0A9K3PK48_9STRA|nr:hypothetical protein IV203_009620 [Nitzschia inconspicua]